jgi:hypothetical protein
LGASELYLCFGRVGQTGIRFFRIRKALLIEQNELFNDDFVDPLLQFSKLIELVAIVFFSENKLFTIF